MPDRRPINIHPAVKDELNELLYSQMFMGTGVGFSAFIKAAIDQCKQTNVCARSLRSAAITSQRSIAQLDQDDKTGKGSH